MYWTLQNLKTVKITYCTMVQYLALQRYVRCPCPVFSAGGLTVVTPLPWQALQQSAATLLLRYRSSM
jgi:hypothetical protein